MTITGALDPGLAQTIALFYTDPTGLVETRTLLTNTEGIYSDQFTPDLTGQWIVTAASARTRPTPTPSPISARSRWMT